MKTILSIGYSEAQSAISLIVQKAIEMQKAVLLPNKIAYGQIQRSLSIKYRVALIRSDTSCK
jgi:hypothetical protein